MITNFRISYKTKRPACCDFDCCGNHFGRIERSPKGVHSDENRIKKTRRYAKRVERQRTRLEIGQQLYEAILDIEEFNLEMEELFVDDEYPY